MATIEIETGLPLPSPKRGFPSKYPWDKLEVGQSFFVSDPSRHFPSTISVEGRKRGRKFSQRAMDGGIRVWRIA